MHRSTNDPRSILEQQFNEVRGTIASTPTILHTSVRLHIRMPLEFVVELVVQDELNAEQMLRKSKQPLQHMFVCEMSTDLRWIDLQR